MQVWLLVSNKIEYDSIIINQIIISIRRITHVVPSSHNGLVGGPLLVGGPGPGSPAPPKSGPVSTSFSPEKVCFNTRIR